VADWIKLHGRVQYVDMITEPGIDRVLAEDKPNRIAAVVKKLRTSITVHQVSIVAVAGHFECAANDANFEKHSEQIKISVDLISSWRFGIRIVGLYVNQWNSVDLICDTDAEFTRLRSFL
jgi:hypothetical protein